MWSGRQQPPCGLDVVVQNLIALERPSKRLGQGPAPGALRVQIQLSDETIQPTQDVAPAVSQLVGTNDRRR